MAIAALSIDEIIERSPISTLQRRLIILSISLALLDGFDSLIIGFLVPALSADWGVSAASLTPVVVSGTVGTIAGAMLLAPIADRLGRRPVILGGAAVFAVFTLLSAVAPNIALLTLFRLLAGVGLGAVPSTLIAYVSEYSPRRIRSTVVAATGSGLLAGGFVGGFAAAFMIPRFGWQSVLLVGGLLPLLPLLLGLRWMPETPQMSAIRGRMDAAARVLSRIDTSFSATDASRIIQKKTSTRGVPVRSLLADNRAATTILVWVLYLSQYVCGYFIFAWLPSLLSDAGAGRSTALAASSMCTLGGLVGGLLLGTQMPKVSSQFRILALNYVVAACAVVATAMAIGASDIGMFAALFVVGFGTFGTILCVNAIIANLYPAEIRSTGLGWAQGFGRIGSVVGPSIGGLLLATQFSTQTIFQLALVPVLVCALALVGLGVIARRDAQSRAGREARLEGDQHAEMSMTESDTPR
ncbi:MFS transporter [Rhodococcus sp. WS4]|nr:MFS transporter [Rhodococcus sp. WS4]